MNRRGRITYALPYFGIAIVSYVTTTWLTYFYAPPEGAGHAQLLPAAWAGAALAVGRVVDAVTDPLVAAWSDRTRSASGRRLPFMRYGAVPFALTFILMWTPPAGAAPAVRFLYLATMTSLFYAAYTIYVAPYLALLPEIAETREERVALTAWQGGFNVAGVSVGGGSAALLIGALGFGGMAATLAAAALLALLWPAFVLRENRRTGAAPAPGLFTSVRLTFANPVFRGYAAGQFFFWIALSTALLGAPYSVTVLMGGGERDAALALAVTMSSALVSFPVVARVAARWGLRRAFRLAMGWMAVVLALWGTMAVPMGPFTPYLRGMLLFALCGPAVAALLTLPNALVAEITDTDFARTGMRREAIYFGVQGLVVKSAVAFSALLSTQLLQHLGYSPGRPGGVLWLGPAAALCVAVGLLIYRGSREGVRTPAPRSAGVGT